MRGRWAWMLAAGCLAAVTPAGADAAYEPARLLSASATEQGLDSSTSPDISPDGQWVVFATAAQNLIGGGGGVLRRDMATGALARVAPEGATAPSVSADGRYVSFVTTQQLVAADTDTVADVYRRDMAAPGAAYTLVSADATGPAIAPAATAMSHDGARVAFVVGAGATGGPVVVRDIPAGRSTVVTVDPSGAVAGSVQASSVVLSGDGSTVLWRNSQVAYRALRPGEGLQPVLWWRRVDGGPVRDVFGLADIESPFCPPSAGVSPPPPSPAGGCDGPLYGDAQQTRDDVQTPGFAALSDDGWTVTWATRWTPRAVWGLGGSGARATDLYVRDMRAPGGQQATIDELTRDGGTARPDDADSADVHAVGISPDGRYVAYRTKRTRFDVLPGVALVSSPFASAVNTEVYVFDRATRTVQRASARWDGAQTLFDQAVPALEHQVTGVSLDANRLVFATQLGDLVRGDGNGDEDVFAVDRRIETSVPFTTAGEVGAASVPFTSADGPWRLRVRSSPRSNGVTRVYVITPASGSVRVRATVRRRGGGRERAAIAVRRATRGGLVSLSLKLGSGLRPRARKARKGLPTRFEVRFTPDRFFDGRRPPSLRRVVDGRFRLKAKTRSVSR